MRAPEYNGGEPDVPLMEGGCGGCTDEYFLEYDEDGSLALARALRVESVNAERWKAQARAARE